MIQFEKPNYKITDYVEKNNYGRFVLEPLERGFGATIGNALRRVMLSSLPGSAITSVKIDNYANLTLVIVPSIILLHNIYYYLFLLIGKTSFCL